MKKTIIILLIALLLIAMLTACGDNDNAKPTATPAYPTIAPVLFTATPDPSCYWDNGGTPDDYADDIWVCGGGK